MSSYYRSIGLNNHAVFDLKTKLGGCTEEAWYKCVAIMSLTKRWQFGPNLALFPCFWPFSQAGWFHIGCNSAKPECQISTPSPCPQRSMFALKQLINFLSIWTQKDRLNVYSIWEYKSFETRCRQTLIWTKEHVQKGAGEGEEQLWGWGVLEFADWQLL